MKKIKDLKLDAEEQELSDSFDKSEWRSVKNLKQEIAAAKKTAKNTLRKDARINIRLSNTDLVRIKQKAAFEGIPYQTLIASILHKYAVYAELGINGIIPSSVLCRVHHISLYF